MFFKVFHVLCYIGRGRTLLLGAVSHYCFFTSDNYIVSLPKFVQVQEILEGAKVLEWLREHAEIEYITR